MVTLAHRVTVKLTRGVLALEWCYKMTQVRDLCRELLSMVARRVVVFREFCKRKIGAIYQQC